MEEREPAVKYYAEERTTRLLWKELY